jgi:thiol-disulfide isomerase/thioredoxin
MWSLSKSHSLIAACAMIICMAALSVCSPQIAHAKEQAPLKVKKGDIPPEGLGYTRDGKLILTPQFAGKVLVVTFWATWCAPCRAEISYLEALQRKLSKDILQVVAVNIEDRDVYRNAIRKMHDFQMLIVNDRDKRYADMFGVGGIPHMLIIGKDGKVAAVHRGYSEAFIPRLAEEIVAALYVGVPQAGKTTEATAPPAADKPAAAAEAKPAQAP